MNQLSNSHSPYLLQHAHNPVDWYEWGPEALEKARKENKLIIVSIGYAACHWCHVMEKESFEDNEVAEVMNQHYVCIKVDREERPDIDKFYMDAVTIMMQHGGWPLNCIALPDGRPIYGGTYFPKSQWIHILNKIAAMYRDRPGYALEYAEKLTEAIQHISAVPDSVPVLSMEDSEIKAMMEELLLNADMEWGGNQSGGNKFPLPNIQRFLMEVFYYTGNTQIREWLHTTLRQIALGGIYDVLAGGFARYSTDPFWRVPHFEKMLYDNAQLVSLYALAYQSNPVPLYKNVVYQTLGFIRTELTSPEGGFYSSLDADSEGEEGKYYVWEKQEAEDLITFGKAGDDEWLEAVKVFLEFYHLKEKGNWEHGKNVLYSSEPENEFLNMFGEKGKKYSEYFHAFKEILLKYRAKRIKPALDNKILASWNGLMLKGLCEAYMVFSEPEWLNAALKNADYLWVQFTESIPRPRGPEIKTGPGLYRNAQRTIPGFLDDYAFVIDAYLHLYSATFDAQWAGRAELLLNTVFSRFYDTESGLFFYTQGNDNEWVRKYEISDDVIPSSNAIMAGVLWKFYKLYGNTDYRDKAEKMLRSMKGNILKHPAWNSAWASLGLKFRFPQYEVVLTGSEALAFLPEIADDYRPDCFIAGSTQEESLPIVKDRVGEQTRIYVCRGSTCLLPVKSWSDAKALLNP
ncbi:MAG: thioredoxin domain-containing protein [Bacteroidia bacterium]|nr:thioredoxin domain-containing protein [Bacteroidia bacterium]